ncbi:hypothetical protein N7450_000603 [Penicillium hetheringtonii]|uniref:Uncharacterized protein n=1 Tax=Penicillium hetheringtonii TaxID=911720 RepID=A0AAD6H1W8_9EURO|nr:hypothetical protein N7450_000603 [Penicillium hetheringtonii]
MKLMIDSLIDPPASPVSSHLQPTCLEKVTCLEKIHYPIFDPRNPNHNPHTAHALLQSPTRNRQEFQTSSSESNKQSSWLEEFPRRSIHKARSGLLAIRASLLRFSSREGSDLSETYLAGVPREDPTHERDYIRRPGLSSTTQEDLSFGVGLYRTATSPWTGVTDGLDEDSVPRGVSSLPLVNVNSAPAELESHYYTSDDPEPMNEKTVSITSGQPPPYRRIEENERYHRSSKIPNPGENANEEPDPTADESFSYLTRSDPLDNWPDLGSPASSFRYEDMIRSRRITSSPDISPCESPPFSVHGSVTAQSEQFKSPEKLEICPGTQEARSLNCDREDSASIQNLPSEVVAIAFPGIYQALLDQWDAESRNKIKGTSHYPDMPACGPVMASQDLQPSAGEKSELSGKRHSFGLHMSLRDVSSLWSFRLATWP